MDAAAWVAIVAALISMAALYPNIKSAKAAEAQTEIQRKLRKDAAQPYVWADILPDEAVGTLLNFVIGNSGPTVARNVRVFIDPPLPAIEEFKERIDAVQERLASGSGIPSLTPGRRISWILGQGFNLLGDEDRKMLTITVEADGPFGPMDPVTYSIDMTAWRESLDRPSGSLHELTKAVKSLKPKA